MTLQELQTKANAKLVTFWDALEIRQDAYFALHGKYFQLLITDPVVDGVDTTWELRQPNDELHALDVGFEFNSPVPFSIRVNEWSGDTPGYQAWAEVTLPNDDMWFRWRDSDQNDSGWKKYDPAAYPPVISV